jgi:hypothetical protein
VISSTSSLEESRLEKFLGSVPFCLASWGCEVEESTSDNGLDLVARCCGCRDDHGILQCSCFPEVLRRAAFDFEQLTGKRYCQGLWETSRARPSTVTFVTAWQTGGQHTLWQGKHFRLGKTFLSERAPKPRTPCKYLEIEPNRDCCKLLAVYMQTAETPYSDRLLAIRRGR